MQVYYTTACARRGHPEFTLQMAQRGPVPDLHLALARHLESAVAAGTKFVPGQTIRLGWSTLRVSERDDGTLGIQARVPAPTVQWTDALDRVLRDLWLQREVVASVDLLAQLNFPSESDAVMVADCALDAPALLLARVAAAALPAGVSGWTLSCAEPAHEHGARRVVPLLALAANQPGLVQFLALPHETVVRVRYRAKPDAPPGARRIEPHVYRAGGEITPAPGSYLAALQA